LAELGSEHRLTLKDDNSLKRRATEYLLSSEPVSVYTKYENDVPRQ